MSLPPRLSADRLWARLAHAQEVAAADPKRPRRPAGGPSLDTELSTRGSRSRGWAARRRFEIVALTLGMGIVAAAGVAVFLQAQDRSERVAAVVPAADSTERALVADARTDLPLRFADGSTVVFRAGATGRLRRPTLTGAEVVLERGSLEAHVIHADTTLWLVHAGPYRVRVTGTRFAMTWTATNLEVKLYEGSVVIDGALLGAGVPLRAGQRLQIASGVVLIEPLGPSGAAPMGGVLAAAPGVAGASGPSSAGPPSAVHGAVGLGGTSDAGVVAGAAASVGRLTAALGANGVAARAGTARMVRRAHAPRQSSSDEEWLALAERGAYGDALGVARRLGWATLCLRLEARHLLTLGDVARYSGARVQARRAFESLVARFPDDRLAGDAVFSLGRLAFEARRPDDATRWFHRYVADWPDGPLADQAAGRLVEAAIRMDDREVARNAARAYLARAPQGPQAPLAREVLDQPSDGSP